MRQKTLCIIPLSHDKKNGGVRTKKTSYGSARTLTTDRDAQQHLDGLSQQQSREDGISAPLLSMKGKHDFVPFLGGKKAYFHLCTQVQIQSY